MVKAPVTIAPTVMPPVSIGHRIEYAFESTLFLFAMFHALVYMFVYVIALLSVVVQGEKGKVNKKPTRLVAAVLLVFYTVYNIFVYSVVLSTVNLRLLYTNRIFVRSVFDNPYAIVLLYEPVVQMMTAWGKVSCALHSIYRLPSNEAVSATNILTLMPAGVDDLPLVVVVMPIYNEPLPSLMGAINSVVETVYPNHRIHLVLAFDEGSVTPLYRSVMHCLNFADRIDVDATRAKGHSHLDQVYASVEISFGGGVLSLDESYPSIQDVEYRGMRVTPCRFPHGGKRHAQMCAYNYLTERYAVDDEHHPAKPLVLFIDSDILLDAPAINHFVYELTANKNRQALTGLITCKTAWTYSFLRTLQDTEYIESQMMQRTTEDYLGSVSCLPGALTIIRFEALQSIAKEYFDNMVAKDAFDFARCHLGEDRYLTHLLMEKESKKYRIGYCSAARCKTEGCGSLYQLLKQRRRWYLGTLVNEIHMLCSPLLWKSVPALLVLQAFMSLKNGPLFMYVFVSEQMMGNASILTLSVFLAIFLPIWAFVAWFGIFKINRRKIAWCYPICILTLPLLSSIFQLYGVYTMRVRSWGGPRAAVEAPADEPAQPEIIIK